MNIVNTMFLACTIGSVACEDRLGLHVAKHKPCTTTGKWSPMIEFGTSGETPLQPVETAGCYSIKGNVTVLKKLRGKLQLYSEVRYSLDKNATPEPCVGGDVKTGCGGVGSCVYCEDCDSLRDEHATKARVTLTRKGKPFDCDEEDLKPGSYNDLKLTFCMPTESELRNSFDSQTWTNIRKLHPDDIKVYMSLYMFETTSANVARAMQREQTIIKRAIRRRDAHLRAKYIDNMRSLQFRNGDRQPEPVYGLPMTVTNEQLAKLPVHNLINDGKHIACHRVAAKLLFTN